MSENKKDCLDCDVREKVMGRIKQENIKMLPCRSCDCRKLVLTVGIILAGVLVYFLWK